MQSATHLKVATARAAVAGLLAWGLFGAAVASAATDNTLTPGQPTGTLVGSVTCGPNDQSTDAPATVAIPGTDLSTHADASGDFVLPVPASQTFTIEALSPSGANLASRTDVSVGAGQTLDVGALDLAVCSPASTATTPGAASDPNIGDAPGSD